MQQCYANITTRGFSNLINPAPEFTPPCTHPPLVQFKYVQKIFILESSFIEITVLSVFLEKDTAELY